MQRIIRLPIRIARPAGLLIIVLTLVGCELYSSTEGGREVAGISFVDLFRPPSLEEISAVESGWAQRSTEAVDVRIEAQFSISVSTLYIVSHNVSGVRHVGAILVPDGAAPGSLPVVVYSHGGESGVSIDNELLLVLSLFEDVADEFVYVVPSFRSESIRFQGNTWRSSGSPSPWDYDVDDALALLTATPAVAPAADMDRIAVIGFSRGAGVALLMAIRDARIDSIIEFFGPTDFLGPFVQDVVEEALLGSPRDLPGLDFLNENFIQPLKDGELSINEVRKELIRRSPVLFVHRLPDLQIHHGTDDLIVPVSQAESLVAAMQTAGRGAPSFEWYLYEGGQHSPLTMIGSLDRTVEFLSRNLGN